GVLESAPFTETSETSLHRLLNLEGAACRRTGGLRGGNVSYLHVLQSWLNPHGSINRQRDSRQLSIGVFQEKTSGFWIRWLLGRQLRLTPFERFQYDLSPIAGSSFTILQDDNDTALSLIMLRLSKISAGTLSYEEAQEVKQAAVILVEILRRRSRSLDPIAEPANAA
ncbi:3233_t:CDS:2, partial [Paraglomus occultum]